MAQDVGSSGAGTNVQDDFAVAPERTEGPDDSKETRWENTNWTDWLGYFNQVPEFNAVVTAKAVYTVGKGSKESKEQLDKFVGWGKDNFNDILKNCIMTYQVGGDSFCEIIREGEEIINIKPLDPGSIVIVVDGKGMLKHYEQKSKVEGNDPKKILIENMFHMARNRFADNIHGTALTEKLTNIILSRNESMDDYKQVQHRFVKPRWIIRLNTDNQAKINAEKVKWDRANADGENMYIPMKSVEAEQMSIAEGSTLNPLAWQESLNNNFYLVSGVPKVILGDAGGTAEAGVKMEYFAFQQMIEEEQLFVESQVKDQLGIEINLEPPASLEKDLNKDNSKDGEMKIKQSETTASLEGKK